MLSYFMEDISYNIYLYNIRKEKKLSRHKFARFLGINSISYGFIEKGYLKPSKRQAKKISAALGIDYSQYLEGASSYPTDLPDKDRTKVVNAAYHLISFTWLKILLTVLIGFFAAVMISGYKIEDQVNSDSRQFYSEKYLNYFDTLREKGTETFSLTSEFTRPEIFEKSEHALYSIKGSYQENEPSHIEYTATYHFDDYRLSYKYTQGETILRGTLYYYESGESYQAVYGEPYDDPSAEYKVSYPIVSVYYRSTKIEKGTDEFDAIQTKFETDDNLMYLSTVGIHFDMLIYGKLGLEMSLSDDIFPELKNGGRRQMLLGVTALAMKVGGLVLAAASLFGLCFCIFYGEKKGVLSLAERERQLPKQEEVRNPQFRTMKTDWKIPALVPETVLEILGIIMVFAGSLRVLYYFLVFMGYSYVSGNEFTEIPLAFFRVFLIGMFLLYYIDFDSFMDDKRLIRCIFTYLIVFVGLYGVEMIGFDWAEDAHYLVLDIAIPKVANSVPNNFSSITCYFLLMYFLFHRPTFIKSNRGRIFFRLLAIIPIGIIIFTTLVTLFQDDWGWNLSRQVLFLFKSEKPQFSCLCVTYLVGYYFLRLYYYHKLGHTNAERYFNGNKFIWQKNILVCTIVLVISIFEFALKDNSVANSHGFGYYSGLIFLIPVLLFYHPHKGHRNLAVDWATLGFYGLSFALGYILIGIIIFDAILNEGFSVENILRYLGNGGTNYYVS